MTMKMVKIFNQINKHKHKVKILDKKWPAKLKKMVNILKILISLETPIAYLTIWLMEKIKMKKSRRLWIA